MAVAKLCHGGPNANYELPDERRDGLISGKQLASDYHEHVQLEASAEWTIHHNFGVKPAVKVFVNWTDGAEHAILPNRVVASSNDIIVIYFTRPFSGRAVLV